MFKDDTEVERVLGNPLNLIKRSDKKPRRQLEDLSERKVERVESIDIGEGTVEIAPLHNGGRREGDKNMSPEMRGLVGAVARLDTGKNVAAAFGVSEHHVHELKHGMHSTEQGQNDELVDAVNEKLSTPHDIALSKLTATLLEITPAKLSLVKKVESLAGVAASLSTVARNTAPIQKESANNSGAKLVVYAPVFKQENHYGTVSVDNQSMTTNQPAINTPG